MNLKIIAILGILLFVYSCTYNNVVDLQPKQELPVDTTGKPITTTGGINQDTVPNVVSLSTHILPIFDRYSCRDGSCHGGASSSGGVYLGSYNGIKIVASNGQLYNSVAKNGKASPMPSGSRKLTTTELATVKKWIDNGASNN